MHIDVKTECAAFITQDFRGRELKLEKTTQILTLPLPVLAAVFLVAADLTAEYTYPCVRVQTAAGELTSSTSVQIGTGHALVAKPPSTPFRSPGPSSPFDKEASGVAPRFALRVGTI